MSPRIDYSNAAELALIGTVGPYALFSGIQEFNLTGKQLFRISVDVEDETGNTVAMFFKLFGLLA